ncbi:hypothetical protein CYD30_25010 [Kosakonia cowanii]|nr:hypothetical protein CYD30_25010 [Kosakonia cowanii]
MRKTRLALCSMMLMLVISGCSSTPTVQPCQRINPPAPAAWAMQPVPPLQQMLNGIIGVSEVGSQPSPTR